MRWTDIHSRKNAPTLPPPHAMHAMHQGGGSELTPRPPACAFSLLAATISRVDSRKIGHVRVKLTAAVAGLRRNDTLVEGVRLKAHRDLLVIDGGVPFRDALGGAHAGSSDEVAH